MSWIKVSLINVIVLIGLLITAEVGLRIVWTGYKCISQICDFSRLTRTLIYEADFTETNIGLSTYDEILGYKPTPDFSASINASNWDNKQVTIESNGFRSNGNADNVRLSSISKILTVGDSFTFGDQVNDAETWSACLELKTNRETLNAGVFGYGTAQAIKRASSVTKKLNIDTVILSIYVNSDFYRDRLKFRSGFPRPAVILREGEILYADVPSIDSSGTKWKPTHSSILKFLDSSSMVGIRIINYVGYDVTGMTRTELHPDAASIEQIIQFSIDEFSKLDAKEKIIVLQYELSDFPHLQTHVEKIRDKVLSESRTKEIPVIDTYTRLQKELLSTSKEIWRGHHTAYGNLIVCDEIYRHIQI
jgi:hypothetical protein